MEIDSTTTLRNKNETHEWVYLDSQDPVNGSRPNLSFVLLTHEKFGLRFNSGISSSISNWVCLKLMDFECMAVSMFAVIL